MIDGVTGKLICCQEILRAEENYDAGALSNHVDQNVRVSLKNVRLHQHPVITPKPADSASFKFYQTFYTQCTIRHLIYQQVLEKSGMRFRAEEIDRLIADGIGAVTQSNFDNEQQVLTLPYSVADAQYELRLPTEFIGSYDANLRITEAFKYVFASDRQTIVKADAFTQSEARSQDMLYIRADKSSRSVYAAITGPSAERVDEAQEFAFFVDDELVQQSEIPKLVCTPEVLKAGRVCHCVCYIGGIQEIQSKPIDLSLFMKPATPVRNSPKI